MNRRELINSAASILREKDSFLVMTHKDPDTDAIGSMLAAARALESIGKKVVSLSEKPLLPPLVHLNGSEKIYQELDSVFSFDVILILDCSSLERLGELERYAENGTILINIDHHETNVNFGDLNIVAADCSSTGELVLEVIKAAAIEIDYEIAENIFAAVQGDTGSFRYDNTTQASFYIAGEMMGYGVKPWEVARKMIDSYSPQRLKLLESALNTLEFHHEGKVGIMTLSSEMFRKTGANREDSEGFGDYPRYVPGVRIGVLIRQTGHSKYKFSLRSNEQVNVARLASLFGGGGHSRAAGFECHGAIGALKKFFLEESLKFLNGAAS